MARKRTIIIAVILGIAILFVAKDYLFKAYFTYYIEKKFSGDCKIKRAHLLLKGISVEGLNFSSPDMDFILKEGQAKIALIGPFLLRFKHLILKDPFLNIKSMQKGTQTLGTRSVKRRTEPTEPLPLKLDLQNSRFQMEYAGYAALDVKFSFQGKIKGIQIEELEQLSVSNFNSRGKYVEIKGARLEEMDSGKHALIIPQLKIMDNEIKDLAIPVTIKDKNLILERTKQESLGDIAYLEGVVEFGNFNNICVRLDLSDVSFSNIMGLVYKGEDIALKGMFDGQIKSCFKGAKPMSLKTEFFNNQGGFVHIKKEASFDLLRKQLDKTTYNKLIDNLENYRYNEGNIAIHKEENNLVVKILLDSEEMGKMDITLNLHNIFGGEQ